jgi:hypothetical protein
MDMNKKEFLELPIESLTLFEKNPRKHMDSQIEEIKKSVSLFGQYKNIVIDENNMILAGNGLYTAMKELGEKTVGVYRVTGLSEAQKKKLVIVDNKLQDLSRTDIEILEDLLKEINETDIPGYDEDSLRALFLQIESDSEKIEEFIDEKYKNIFSSNDTVDSEIGDPSNESSLSSGAVSVKDDQDKEDSADFGIEYVQAHKPYPPVKIEYSKRLICPHCKKEVWF